jgi:transcriptional regulator with XRE-family HTH domain
MALLLELLREARFKAGVTQVELAERLGMDQTYVSKIEKGVRRIDAVELMLWVEALDNDLYKFFAKFKRGLKAMAIRRRPPPPSTRE